MTGRTHGDLPPPDDKDPLMAELAALAREEHEREPDAALLAELERLAAGTLSDADAARLVAEAPQATVSLYEPLGPDFQARAVDTALAGLGLAPAQPAPANRSSGSVVPMAVARRRMMWALLPVAAAAGLSLWLMRPPARGPLAEYTLQILGGEASTRAEPSKNTEASLPTIGPGSRLSFVLRPSREAVVPLAARAWLARNGELRPWAVVPEVSEAGAVRIAGTWESLGLAALEPGEWDALIVVSTPDHLPGESEIHATLDDSPPADAPWRMQRGRFIVRRAP